MRGSALTGADQEDLLVGAGIEAVKDARAGGRLSRADEHRLVAAMVVSTGAGAELRRSLVQARCGTLPAPAPSANLAPNQHLAMRSVLVMSCVGT